MRRWFLAVDRVVSARWFPWALAVVAGVVAVASKHLVYPELSWNRDEPVYRWQAELLRDGQLTSTDGGYPAIFHPWLTAHHDGRFFTQYPLGWPGAILAGEVVGWPDLTLVVACAMAVLGTYVLAFEVTRRRRIAGLAASLFLLSPIVAVQSGVFLTYLFGTGLGTLFVAALLGGVRTGSRRRLAAAGLLLGAVVMTRTFDAVVWATAAGSYVLVAERHRWRSLLRLLPAFVAGAVPLVVLQLVHNWWTTGSPTQFAITVADPLDTFGFGARRLMPRLDAYDYTPGRAAVGTAKHLFFLPWFLAGAHLGGAAALFGAWRDRAEHGTRLLLVLCLAFPLAYLPFWGIHISSLTTRISGPIYYIPIYAPLCVLMALGVVHLARRAPRATAIGVVASLVVTGVFGVGRLGVNRHLSRIQSAWATIEEEIDGEAIVAVSPAPYLLFLAPDGITRPDVPGRLTYVVDEDPSLVDYVDRSDRPAYLARPSVAAGDLAPSETTGSFAVEVVPMDLVRGPALDLDVTVVAPRAGAMVIDVANADDVIWSAPVAEVDAGATRSLSVPVGHDRTTAGPDGIVVTPGGTTLEVVVGVGATEAEARRAPTSRYRLLVSSGPVMRALQPGRWYQPDEYALGQGELRWLDGVPDPSVVISLAPRLVAEP
jgi:4-amino-4-deoxy-L-arabinose transferase-like glycosyltransferase